MLGTDHTPGRRPGFDVFGTLGMPIEKPHALLSVNQETAGPFGVVGGVCTQPTGCHHSDVSCTHPPSCTFLPRPCCRVCLPDDLIFDFHSDPRCHTKPHPQSLSIFPRPAFLGFSPWALHPVCALQARAAVTGSTGCERCHGSLSLMSGPRFLQARGVR